ncbi:tRNA threonylcarbamoyladenosine dehydratase [Treponema phagedenis]|uniref:tRNA threonylcarbamoyladenosine dehydratase n=1 Tax=Treponema phagedenis TaxID=162 RepID=UPI001AF77916|nr:ThiF family adenylyltransferase [Treponema phagedenis]QSH94326.1 tRNA threonylcarbamoyladenosine dehydratase [Treponema phagedenis]
MTAENSEQFSRSLPLLGEGGMKKLFSASVAVFGLGGVGGFVVEGLARAGIGTLYIVDGDYIQESNINRQLIAVHSSIGQAKTEAWEQRIKDINPLCSVVPIHQFILPSSDGSIDAFPFWNSVDYIVDAIDTVSAKIALAAEAEKRQIPIIAAMGCGNKLDASAFCFADM